MKHFILFWLLLLGLHSAPALAEIPAEHLARFATLPILHEGRLKPLDSFARFHFQAVSGAAAPDSNTSLTALAKTLFTPASTLGQPVFLIRSPDVVHRLGLEPRDKPLYSFQELVPAILAQQELITNLLATNRKTLAPDERELLALYATVDDERQLTGALSLLLPITMPLPDSVFVRLGLPQAVPLTLLDLLRLKPDVMEKLQATMATKQERIGDYTPEEQENAALAYQITLLESVGANNILLRIIPPVWEDKTLWQAPWDLQRQSLLGPAAQQFFAAWRIAAQAWRDSDITRWDQAMSHLENLTQQAQPSGLRHWALTLEIMLNRAAPFTVALWLIGLGGLLLCMQGVMRKTHTTNGVFALAKNYLPQVILFLALLVMGAGLLARMLILQRPPVSTLYESTLFVSFMALLGGFLLNRSRQDGLWIGSTIAALLLLTSFVFGADGDTLLVLTAVLDTNFWLATHVVSITTGYAAALVAGMMAHLSLLRQALDPAQAQRDDKLHLVAIFALLFTTIGTMLGGIWADQSWGRFWGWDPKENGALLIVLWLVWLLHGRVAGQLKPFAFTIGMALITIIVALAWFGVNLLGIGLHSYGFSDAAAWGLLLFCAGEVALIGGLALTCWLRRRRYAA